MIYGVVVTAASGCSPFGCSTPSSEETTYSLKRATGVTKANAQKSDYGTNVIGTTDDATHCAADTIKATQSASGFEHTAPSSASTLCDEWSMDAAKQTYG